MCIYWCVVGVKVINTHMFEAVMGHRHSSSLLQVIIPVKVRRILSRVSIWNTHKNTFFFSKLLSSIFILLISHRVFLTRLQCLLTHAGAPSRPRLGALRRNRREGLFSSESSTGPKLQREREENRNEKYCTHLTVICSILLLCQSNQIAAVRCQNHLQQL